MYMLLTMFSWAHLVSYSYQINFPGGGGGGGGGGWVAGLSEIKANSASQQSWCWGLAELGKIKTKMINEKWKMKNEEWKTKYKKQRWQDLSRVVPSWVELSCLEMITEFILGKILLGS